MKLQEEEKDQKFNIKNENININQELGGGKTNMKPGSNGLVS